MRVNFTFTAFQNDSVVVFGGKRDRLTSYLLTTSPRETGGEWRFERPARTTHSQPRRGVALLRLRSGPPGCLESGEGSLQPPLLVTDLN